MQKKEKCVMLLLYILKHVFFFSFLFFAGLTQFMLLETMELSQIQTYLIGVLLFINFFFVLPKVTQLKCPAASNSSFALARLLKAFHCFRSSNN